MDAPRGPAVTSAAHSAASGLPRPSVRAGRVFARLRPLWSYRSGVLRIGAGGDLANGVLAGVAGNGVIVNQVGACAFRLGVLGVGDEEFTGPGERVRMPSGVE